MKKIALIGSNYYPEITSGLSNTFLKLCRDSNWHVDEFMVYGVSEMPLKFKSLALLNEYDGIAVLGCVVKGETYHNSLINSYVFNKIYDLSLEYMIPLGYGILNVKSYDDAVARSLLNKNNRGIEVFESLELAVV